MPQRVENCPYCRSKSSRYRLFHKVGNIRKLLAIFQLPSKKFEDLFSFNIMECKDCGLFYTDRILTKSEANTFYNYRTYENVNFGEEHRKYYNSQLDYINSVTSLKNKNFLDIGCGSGYLLNLARKRGAIPTGIEIDKRIIDFARKKYQLKIINKDLLEFDQTNQNYYDIIVISAVIEHLANPLEYLKKIYALLKPGGILYVTTPEICFFSKYIIGHYILGHYTFPSRKLITSKLKEIGFQILACKSTRLTFNRILSFIPKLLKSSDKNISGLIARSIPDPFYFSRKKNLLQQVKNLPLMPFSLGICRILCRK